MVVYYAPEWEWYYDKVIVSTLTYICLDPARAHRLDVYLKNNHGGHPHSKVQMMTIKDGGM